MNNTDQAPVSPHEVSRELSKRLAEVEPLPAETVHAEPRLRLELNTEDAFKRPIKLAVELPNRVEDWGILERAMAAKMDPGSAWFSQPFMTVVNAVVFADKQGLSFEEGDVYKTPDSTRFNLSAKARIKRGMATGKVKEYHVETSDGPIIKIPWATYREKGDWEGPDYRCTVTIYINDWNRPMVTTSNLSEWFEGRYANWRIRPKYFLDITTLGRAFELIKPGATTSEEAPEEEKKAPASQK